MQLKCQRIVLTGGPGGGKTRFMNELRAEDPQSRHWLLVPEAAPLLFQAGINAKQKIFQWAVVKLQIALEDSIAAAALPNQILLCHRGTLDPLAYWLRNGWSEWEFFSLVESTKADQFRRYYGVIHLQTTAIDAVAHYRRWPDAHRPESLEQAADTDRLCTQAWREHPRYELIGNACRDWPAKSQAARNILSCWLT